MAALIQAPAVVNANLAFEPGLSNLLFQGSMDLYRVPVTERTILTRGANKDMPLKGIRQIAHDCAAQEFIDSFILSAWGWEVSPPLLLDQRISDPLRRPFPPPGHIAEIHPTVARSDLEHCGN